jgi:hypothetical protein
MYGVGCVLDENHLLTAAHVLKPGSGFIAAIVGQALVRCEISFESKEFDICLLRMVEPLNGRWENVKTFPRLSSGAVSLGTSVAFFSPVSLFRQPEKVVEETATQGQFHLTTGTVSMVLPPDEINRQEKYLISTPIAQKGFGGSAVFLADGTVVGVVIQMLVFQAENDPFAPAYRLPVMSPILTLRKQIQTLLAPAEKA